MPTSFRIEQVETLRAYMELIEDLMASKVPLWYRGAGKTSHPLIPSLFRHPTIVGSVDLMELEGRILQRFRERSIPYLPIPVQGDWELLFVMQHFGVPTRLLDWTESPYIGLFFALTSSAADYATGVAADPAAVWILRPESWNKHALSDISYDGRILSVGSHLLESYRPFADSQYMRVGPVAMYGLHNSPRIVAQRGVFTIFGKEVEPMESLFEDGYADDALVKVEIPGDRVGALRESLVSIGVTDSVVYPDLAGLATELKRYYEYPV